MTARNDFLDLDNDKLNKLRNSTRSQIEEAVYLLQGLDKHTRLGWGVKDRLDDLYSLARAIDDEQKDRRAQKLIVQAEAFLKKEISYVSNGASESTQEGGDEGTAGEAASANQDG